MKNKIAVVLTVFVLLPLLTTAQTKVIAHRGYWKTKGSAQNSITALAKADKLGCYGSELDVWITKDGKLVVNHDPSFNGVNIQESIYDTSVKQLRLSNGEKLPLLRDYFRKAKKLRTMLIVEIKTHAKKERTFACVDSVLSMVHEMGLENRVNYISFGFDAIKRCKEKAPANTPCYYLSGNVDPQGIKRAGLDGIDYNGAVCRQKHPEWIKQSQDLGLKVNIWTINDVDEMRYFISQKVDFITTDEPKKLMKLLKEKK